MYDNERFRGPKSENNDLDWNTIDAKLKDGFAKSKNIRIVSGTNNSPSTKKAIEEFSKKYPGTKQVVYEASSLSAMIEANKKAFNKAVIPGYRFDKAKVIVSFGADFLGTWISPVEFTKQWSLTRKLNPDKKEMSRHIQFESGLSLTGSNADVRIPIKPSAEAIAIASLYNKIATLASAPQLSTIPSLEFAVNTIDNTAKELWNAKGNSLVVCGTNNIEEQLLVNAINSLLGNIGKTIDFDNYSNQHQADDAAFENFVEEMNKGQVDAVIFYNTNPAYSYYDAKKFERGLKKVALTVSTSGAADETSLLCKYIAPDNHYLESWNDNEPKAGYFTLTQPTISNVFNTRQTQESFLKWADVNIDYYSFLKKNWQTSILSGSVLFDADWNKCLHAGFYLAPEKTSQNYPMTALPSDILAGANKLYSESKDKTEISLYKKVGVGDGTHANNPWLQELPDPISKVCWDNYAAIGKVTADKLQLKDGDLVDLKTKNGSIEKLPVLVQPGQAANTISIALGYGRNTGKVAKVSGKNAYAFVSLNKGNFNYSSSDVSISKSGSGYTLAHTQTHHTIEGRSLLREASLNEYVKNSDAGNQEKAHIITLWNEHDNKGHHWGMAIDLNACTGCGSCVVSCTAENNVPVVGREEVIRSREMHWIRIDRYFSFKDKNGKTSTKEKEYNKAENGTDFENVKVIFQPVMCQQCGHAPCETVCPVLATVHSSEGLNQMAYNRCVGTRYCANNCPFKVRRFNWFKYRDNSEFDFNFNHDLGRMVVNPDVTVRSRGVMEKCSFCVQRIQAGKLNAKLENRAMKDGDVKTACQQSCPSDAIVFGDMMDPESEISKL
ncbi:MAG: 4Fe-4S dicluster domain-containing protein, partial [Bacteroidia bacterium]